MLRSGCVLLALAASMLAGGASSGPLTRDRDLFVRPEDQHTTLFGSLDAGRSVFVSGGSKQALVAPLDRPGFLLMETGGYGLTRERLRTDTGSTVITRLKHDATLTLGYQWMSGPIYLAGFLGPEVQTEQATVDGRIRRVDRPNAGLHGQIDLWVQPTPETLLTGTVVAGTARMSVWARGSAGWMIAPGLFLGPEAIAYATPTYDETRWGVHLTGAEFGIVTMRVSVGWMKDSSGRNGAPYTGLSLWFRL